MKSATLNWDNGPRWNISWNLQLQERIWSCLWIQGNSGDRMWIWINLCCCCLQDLFVLFKMSLSWILQTSLSFTLTFWPDVRRLLLAAEFRVCWAQHDAGDVDRSFDRKDLRKLLEAACISKVKNVQNLQQRSNIAFSSCIDAHCNP